MVVLFHRGGQVVLDFEEEVYSKGVSLIVILHLTNVPPVVTMQHQQQQYVTYNTRKAHNTLLSHQLPFFSFFLSKTLYTFTGSASCRDVLVWGLNQIIEEMQVRCVSARSRALMITIRCINISALMKVSDDFMSNADQSNLHGQGWHVQDSTTAQTGSASNGQKVKSK